MAKRSARKAAGLGPPPRRPGAPPVRSKGAPAPAADRRRWLIGGAVVAGVVAVVVVLVIVLGGKSSSSPTATSGKRTIPWSEMPGLQTGPPPWNSSSAVLSDRLSLLGLNALGQEGTQIHIHQHLDVYVNAKKVTVPAQIGIDANQGFLTELHTHGTDGIIHVESPSNTSFTLGQLF